LYVTSGGFEATLDKDKEYVKVKKEEIDSEDDGEGGDG
jgi:hypothetical protein